MGRPKLDYEPIIVELRCSPKLITYLEAIIAEEGHGNTRQAVVESLVWSGIRELVSQGAIDRIKGKLTELPSDVSSDEE